MNIDAKYRSIVNKAQFTEVIIFNDNLMLSLNILVNMFPPTDGILCSLVSC